MTTRRPCQGPCGRNRAERFFTSPKGRICSDCQKRRRRETSRASHVRRTYGLTPEDHARLLEHQGGGCAICNGKRPYELAVDHDHETGLVRGLCCKRCNKLLRDVRDDGEVLHNAADYLQYTPAERIGIEARAAVVLATEGDA